MECFVIVDRATFIAGRPSLEALRTNCKHRRRLC